MDWLALQSIAFIAAGAAVSGVLGYASACQSQRLFWLGLAAVVTFPAFMLGFFSVGMSDPRYFGILLLAIVPWLIGGFIARRTYA